MPAGLAIYIHRAFFNFRKGEWERERGRGRGKVKMKPSDGKNYKRKGRERKG